MTSRHRKDRVLSQILPSHLEFLVQLAHGRSKHKSMKNHCCSFKSVGVTGSKAEIDSKQNEKTNTKQNGDVRGNTPRNHPTPIQQD
ncbi:hypothetical protein LOK49_LG09G01780 [Camellia lanceoleosa]|uniref:Uncharacterized protein n=1 Tax=Camellia lanceoleosa TaxID=1840588 RepID=A0ACC0GG64_9ERIC|nr:hypothetical protein LOK49_LG09G01780 [Camellia lanceoleosa]